MTSSINLLSKRKVVFDKHYAMMVKAKVAAGVVLALYIVILSGVIGFRLVISQQLEATKSGLDKASLSLTSTAALERDYRRVISKSNALHTLIASRRESMYLWKELQNLLPVGTELVTFAIEDDILKIDVKAAHVLVANQVLDLLVDGLTSLGAEKTTAAVSRLPDATYSVGLELQLQKLVKGNQ